MNIYLISIPKLCLALIPLVLVIFIRWRWSLRPVRMIYATARMLLQLSLIGFALTFIFKTDHLYIIGFLLTVMMVMASWISLGSVLEKRKAWFFKALFSLGLIGCSVLTLIVVVIIQPDPWYKPTYLIPLAGMTFSNSMNMLSLSAERFLKERSLGTDYISARNQAWNVALIPMTNSFLAVGLVSLPGMMTGQILAGVDPLIAVRYQILVMATLLGAGSLVSALFLRLIKKDEI